MLQIFSGLAKTFTKGNIYQNLVQRSIFLLTEFNAVDNSELGQTTKRYRKPYLIGFYRKRRTADVGDVIKVAVKGRPCKAIVVNTRKRKLDMEPRYDNNNIVLVDDNLSPLGGKINGPMPTKLRKQKHRYPKVIAQMKNFV
ncbi:large ribosomal subunit protein uL14m-like [Clytia hemisphaerica]|uniref:large ribosomal subunit protein uL14m-like n=1 Tax=Clytia hemisphaerica TaxID=252671 RepID=UPI0034D74B5A